MRASRIASIVAVALMALAMLAACGQATPAAAPRRPTPT
jgi:predicted small lipoprotein YifL